MLSVPAIQTKLGRYVTNSINEDFGTNLTIEKVDLSFLGSVQLKDVQIRDHHKDTLIFVKKLRTTLLNAKRVLDNEVSLKDISLDGVDFYMKTYKGEENDNLSVFIDSFDDGKPRDSLSNSFILKSSNVYVNELNFKLIDANKKDSLNYAVKNAGGNLQDLSIIGPNFSSKIRGLYFVDENGLNISNLTTDFSYSKTAMHFKNTTLQTRNTDIKGDIHFKYKREDLSDFTNKVQVVAKFDHASIALQEINTFYNEFGRNQRAVFTTNISGTLNNLNVNNLNLNTSSKTKINGNFNFKNLFNAAENNFSMQGDFSRLASNYKDLKALLPNVLGESIPSIFDKLGDFEMTGKTHVTTSKITANLDMNTSLGYVVSNLELNKIDDIDNATYKGNIILDEFNLGLFVDDANLNTTSLNLDVDGSGFTQENINTKIIGDVYSLNYNHYTYQNIAVSGNLENKIFNGQIDSQDKNLDLNFNGLVDFSKEINDFDFVANVDYANLKALNFIKNDSLAIFKGIVDMKMKGTTLNNAVGSVTFNDTYYKNQNDEYFFDDFAVTSSFQENIRYIKVNSPDIIEGQMSGVFLIENIDKLMLNAIGSIYTNYIPFPVETNQYVDFNFKIYNKIVEVFVPELKLGKNTFVKGRVESDEKEFKLTFKSPKIEWLDYFANTIELQVDNKNPLFNTYVEVDSLHTNFYNVSKFNLINVTVNDTLFMRSEFKGGKNNNDLFNLSFYHTKNQENQSVVGFKKSDITVKNNTWYINKNTNKYNKVAFDNAFENFNIDQFLITHNEEEIKLSGLIQGANTKDVKLNFKNVHLENITPNIEDLTLKGIVNGTLDVLQQNGNYLPQSKISIDNLEVNNKILGSFNANITGNQSLTNYTLNATIKDDLEKSFSAQGIVDVSQKSPYIDVDVLLKDFGLQPINPFLEGVLRDIRGQVTGAVKVSGNLNKPNINGQLELNKGGLGIPELNVDYAFADKSSVSLQNQSFIFNAIDLTDTVYNTKAKLNGSLSHTNFNDWSLDIDLETNRLLVLNTKEAEDQLYYGTGFVGGKATIVGPANQLRIAVTGETKKGTVFVIPLNENESFGDNTYINFLSPEEKEAKQKGYTLDNREISGLELDFNILITQDAEIEIVMDKESGSTIRGKGEGEILAEINTNGKFKMYGDFVVFEGVYNFRYGGVLQKDFSVIPGGTLAWNGVPSEADIDIQAVYSTQANPTPLLDSPINRQIPVNLILHLFGELEKPDPDYNFVFPTLSSTLRSELDYRLESKDERSNQALYLIATGAFSSGLSALNLNGTIEERLNGIINGLLSNGDNKFQVGLNVELGENRPDYQSDDKLGVTLQTNISERIRVNGKVGVPIGGVNETVIAGDVQIDFLLNEEGTLTAKVFNRENSIRNFGEEIGYTQGLGIAYSVDFDSFKELINIIFKGKKKMNQEKEEAKKKEEESKTPDFIGFKKKNDSIN
ncbi:MAG: translocation/assembly module TamB domain-containing protein [Oceanihabitans sp.]